MKADVKGQSYPFQEQHVFLSPRHPANVRNRYPADPASPFGITHSRYVPEPTVQEAAGLKSIRDFQSTAAILPTTVLSET